MVEEEDNFRRIIDNDDTLVGIEEGGSR